MGDRRATMIVLAGIGNVGRAVVSRLRDWTGPPIEVVGVADRSACLHDPEGFGDEALSRAIEAKRSGRSLREVDLPGTRIEDLGELATSRTLFIDATADRDLAGLWCRVLDAGAAVVLANKHPLCGPWAEAEPLFRSPRLRYEATVGAGLPVISTLNRLLAAGDRIDRIVGTLSGTLGFVLGQVARRVPLSRAVADAIERGYAEPDPRQDLNGSDVARKALILARTLGRPAEPEEIMPESLFPKAWETLPLPGFLDALPSLDAPMADRNREFAWMGQETVYLADVTAEGCVVGLTDVDAASPLRSASGGTNRIEISSEHFAPDPIAIAGPGAGPGSTASGVLGDVLGLIEAASLEVS